MKPRAKIQELYANTLSNLEQMIKRFVCINCTHDKSEHKIQDGVLYCDHREKDELCQCPRFMANEMGISNLQVQANLLKWVLDQEDTSLQIDDCIMPETEIGTIIKPDYPHVISVKVDGIDEPYRTILLESSNKLPVLLPDPMLERVQLAIYTIYPNSNADRTVITIPENKDGVAQAAMKMNDVLLELQNRYGGK